MEQEVDGGFKTCCTCLSADRNLFLINTMPEIFQVFRLIMYDFAGDRQLVEGLLQVEQLVCWECMALMRRFLRFQQQVQNAQEHLRLLNMNEQESMDHTYMSPSLSTLEMVSKNDYDKIFFDYSGDTQWPLQTVEYVISNSDTNIKNEQYELVQAVRSNINLDIGGDILEVPEIVLDSATSDKLTGMMPQLVIGSVFDTNSQFTPNIKGEDVLQDIRVAMPEKIIPSVPPEQNSELKCSYMTEYMPEEDMLASREEAKKNVQYASAIYKCELCIIGFYTQQQVEDHFVSAHRARAGSSACRVCYSYLPTRALDAHVHAHYLRYTCKLCARNEHSVAAMTRHVKEHRAKRLRDTFVINEDGRKNSACARNEHSVAAMTRHVKEHRAKRLRDMFVINEDGGKNSSKKAKQKEQRKIKPGDLRKLLSKTTIEGYQCLECDMFFKTSRSRKNHVAKCHREGLQCDHCKKRFVNKTTLATHLRLHEGPLPREECPICHKMVRTIQLKYHIRRHQASEKYECVECCKVFSHLATYQAHIKYSRAHASDDVYKFPCPMCNKGYPTKEQMQDHFNYQHLGKTSHKCPICEKPIASRANVEKHMMRVHGEKKQRPRNHVCLQCAKAFTDRKALTQHEVIHSGERPLTCDICQQTFKQKASLYTHKKRVHKIFPTKKVVEFMDTKPDGT